MDVLRKLKRKGFFRFIPDKMYYSITYRIHCKGKLNWKNPQTYSEKLNWLKLYDRRDLYHTVVDKYEARNYIREKLGDDEDILVPLYGVYNTFDEIPFDKLPDKFVIKCTHDNGSVKVVDKNNYNKEALKKFIVEKQHNNFFHYSGREWPYKGLPPRIIAEKYLELEDGSPLPNYRFNCFNGIPQFIVVETGNNADENVRLDHYDFDFNLMPFSRGGHEHLGNDFVKPKNLEKMLEIAKKLSEDFPFVRVDLYEVDGHIYFSELTLYPGAGFVYFEPDEWNYKIGDMLDISKVNVSKGKN
jgi:hypothetical protein